jgi:uncharacterized protein involved in cysteine biosynthesis
MNNCDYFKVCGLCQGRSFLLLAPRIKTCLATLMVTAMKNKVQFVKMTNFESFITRRHFMEYPANWKCKIISFTKVVLFDMLGNCENNIDKSINQ